ncbi:P-II family nitrogen regulator [Beggiatoa leptomitoformis]|uniref:P-II family nitrogen regulator n=1 Tax=Beggiatoa leptomitoformis TaxID=288004 RepID=A0A2N9YGC9_9GAMM|nr:P-II family nitrogen regulator [Beggiatoa leptomitoformis]ALG68143.1 P-II family nitrogen regulator [Beggiatoa leptomitoformis]AUI69560.1 P-II family nitrogen regulator [Beggiatoa leptomitoformis]
MSKEIVVLTDVVLITCIVQRGVADAVVHAAREAGAQGATIFFARGVGLAERLGLLSITIDSEKEIIKMVVSSDLADHIFERIFVTAKLDTPGMGFMYMTPLEKAATYVPPEVIGRLHKGEQRYDDVDTQDEL